MKAQDQMGARLDMTPYLKQKFFMPAETARHDACWIAWPSRSVLWGNRLAAVRREHALVARTIARFEPVVIVCCDVDAAEAHNLCGDLVRIWICPIDDSWIRDSGPTFLVGDHGGLAIVDWAFNAWGYKYQPYAADAALKRGIAEDLGLPLVTNRLIAEGGAILSDGEGTVITTKSCLLNANRNRGLDQAAIEAELLDTLGADKIVWLPGDIGEVETDGHVDCLASIVAPGRVMMGDPATTYGARREILQENRRALLAQADAQGRRFEIIDIPVAPSLDVADPRHQPSYVNFYIANGAVVMPGHGIAADADARAAVAAAFPEREVVQLLLEALPYGGGSIHCITQHQPSCLQR
ncbi:MAG: agmatine deiminase family protein [Pseudomonadota bacterium]|nr:agmatine deiminase family protein [Pseudomonadota bacterium]